MATTIAPSINARKSGQKVVLRTASCYLLTIDSTTSLDVDDMKQHLTSGFHQGTDHRCLKCLRHFKTPVALIAHMESNSERCRVKETDTFGQMLSVVSGGFLGVGGRHSDGSIKIVALNKEELEEQESEQRALMPYEDVDFNWSL